MTNTLIESEVDQAKKVYIDSEYQPRTYDLGPEYIKTISSMVKSMHPKSVLAFGCNAARDLDQIRGELPHAYLLGVDLIEFGMSHFGLDLHVADKEWLSQQADDSLDVIFTV